MKGSPAYAVPVHLRNAPTRLMKQLGFGAEYVYPPDVGYVSDQSYLPPELASSEFFVRTRSGGGLRGSTTQDMPAPPKRPKVT